MRRYGALNVSFAALYAYLGLVLTPGRSQVFNLILAAVILLLAGAGAGLLLGTRWGRTAALIACSLLLVFAFATILLLVASSAYLKGVYGALGQGLAVVTLLVAALAVELLALLPIFELRFLLGRR